MYARSIYHQAVLSRRELFERIGVFDISYSLLADQDWFLRAMTAKARGFHTGIPVCVFEIGGACSNWRKLHQERSRMQHHHYRWGERLLFEPGWFVLKAVHRLLTGNFAMPVGWRR
jgi:hypothetical protein